jgi:hypothetical protein
MTPIKVRVGADIATLMRFYFAECDPPYFYLRCRGCDRREFLPWDPRLRAREALDLLLAHGKCLNFDADALE